MQAYSSQRRQTESSPKVPYTVARGADAESGLWNCRVCIQREQGGIVDREPTTGDDRTYDSAFHGCSTTRLEVQIHGIGRVGSTCEQICRDTAAGQRWQTRPHLHSAQYECQWSRGDQPIPDNTVVIRHSPPASGMAFDISNGQYAEAFANYPESG